jgi:hypothetical protein
VQELNPEDLDRTEAAATGNAIRCGGIVGERMARRDSDIDGLYQLPLEQFTAARTALAKESGSDEAPRIRALAKPTLPAWAVNQVYWTARDKYDALVSAAERIRSAHRAALAGKNVDLRDADEAHRRALNAALKEALAILERAGHPATSSTVDVVSKTLSALPADGEPPGRLTRPLTPGGFELFANVKPAARVLRMPERRPAERDRSTPSDEQKREGEERRRAAARETLREAESSLRKAETQASRHAERVERAEAALAEAEREEREARRVLEKTEARVEAARTALDEVRRSAQRAARDLTDRTAERDAADRRLHDLLPGT